MRRLCRQVQGYIGEMRRRNVRNMDLIWESPPPQMVLRCTGRARLPGGAWTWTKAHIGIPPPLQPKNGEGTNTGSLWVWVCSKT